MALLTDQFVGRAEELGSFDQVLGEVDQGVASALVLIGEPGIGKTRFLAEFARSRRRAWAARPCRLGFGARTRPPVLRFRGRVRRVPARARPRSPGYVGRRPAHGAFARLPFALCFRDRERRRTPARALPQSPGGPRAARGAGKDAVTGPCARRRPLGRPGFRRASRRAAAAAPRCGRPHRPGRPPTPDAGAPLGRDRTGRSCGGGDPDRAGSR